MSVLSIACCCLPWIVSSVQLRKLLLEQAVSEHQVESVSHPSWAVLDCLASRTVRPAAQAYRKTKLHAMIGKAEHAAWQLLLNLENTAAESWKHEPYNNADICCCKAQARSFDTTAEATHAYVHMWTELRVLSLGYWQQEKLRDTGIITGTACQSNNSSLAKASHEDCLQVCSQKHASCRQPKHASQPCEGETPRVEI